MQIQIFPITIIQFFSFPCLQFYSYFICFCCQCHSYLELEFAALLSFSSLLSYRIYPSQTSFLISEIKIFEFGFKDPANWKKEEESISKSSNIVISFSKQNSDQMNSEAELYKEQKNLWAEILIFAAFNKILIL